MSCLFLSLVYVLDLTWASHRLQIKKKVRSKPVKLIPAPVLAPVEDALLALVEAGDCCCVLLSERTVESLKKILYFANPKVRVKGKKIVFISTICRVHKVCCLSNDHTILLSYQISYHINLISISLANIQRDAGIIIPNITLSKERYFPNATCL